MRANKVDENQKDIVSALRAAGCSVQPLTAVKGGVPDLLIGLAGANHLIEVKNKKGKGDRLTPAQVKFHAEWLGEIHRVTTPQEALEAIGLYGTVPPTPRSQPHAAEPDRS